MADAADAADVADTADAASASATADGAAKWEKTRARRACWPMSWSRTSVMACCEDVTDARRTSSEDAIMLVRDSTTSRLATASLRRLACRLCRCLGGSEVPLSLRLRFPFIFVALAFILAFVLASFFFIASLAFLCDFLACALALALALACAFFFPFALALALTFFSAALISSVVWRFSNSPSASRLDDEDEDDEECPETDIAAAASELEPEPDGADFLLLPLDFFDPLVALVALAALVVLAGLVGC